MNKYIKYWLLLPVSLLFVNNSFSQSLKITPTSRLLIDGGGFWTKNADLTGGVAIRDFRMGLKANYDSLFYIKADASFVGNKVSLKDIYILYNLRKNSIVQLGHFTIPFGLSSAYGTAHKQFMAEPSSNVFQVGRRIGIMHSIWNHKLWLSYGVFADNKSLTESTDVSGSQGFTIAERFVYKPICNQNLLQIGLSFSHTQAEAAGKGNSKFFNYKTTYLTVIDKTNAVNVVVDNAKFENKGTVEFAGIYGNFALESQYYYSLISIKDNSTYNADGFYIVARGIILNRENYKSDIKSAGIATPTNKSLEMAVGYSMLNLNNSKSNIYGGKMNDLSAGLSFFWNKHITIRTNYSYIWVKTIKDDPTKYVNSLQCRVQYYF